MESGIEKAIQLLEKELADDEKALRKSIDLYRTEKIDMATHVKHKDNLEPTIDGLKYCISLLNFRKKWNELTPQEKALLY